MKVATYRIGGQRRVGVIDEVRKTVSPFDIPESEAQLGVLALIDRSVLPRVLSSMPLSEAVLEAPIPRPRRNIYCVGKNYHEHAKEFAASGFDSSAVAGAVPEKARRLPVYRLEPVRPASGAQREPAIRRRKI